jgi:group I intron endonuclease
MRPCIYKIINKVNRKFYIGSTLDIKDRWREHKKDLREDKHHSIHLQRAWNKYGEDNFEIQIIEWLDGVNEEELREKEKYYIELLKPYKRDIGYNVSRGAKTCILYGKENGFYGKTHTEETRKCISQKLKKYFQKYGHPCIGRTLSDETKKKISIANKGRKMSKEFKKRISEANKGRKPWNAGIKLPKEVREKLSQLRKGELNNQAKITTDIARKIKMALYCDMDIKEIAKTLNISTDIIYNIKNLKTWSFILSELNDYIKNRERIYKGNKEKEVLELYIKGFSTNKISKILKMSRNSIRKYLRENNIDIIQKRNQYLHANTEVTNQIAKG